MKNCFLLNQSKTVNNNKKILRHEAKKKYSGRIGRNR